MYHNDSFMVILRRIRFSPLRQYIFVPGNKREEFIAYMYRNKEYGFDIDVDCYITLPFCSCFTIASLILKKKDNLREVSIPD